jgi:hypothetical protein
MAFDGHTSAENSKGVFMPKVYVLPQRDGWLLVRPDGGGSNFSIPEYLAVDFSGTRIEAGIKRDFFTILEGVNKGKKASVRWENNKSNLSDRTPVYQGAARLALDKRTMKLSFPGGIADVADLSSTPIPNGTHPVQIADFPHEGGNYYLSQSPYATCWFHIGIGPAVSGSSGRDRYLHAGSGSAGCVTMVASGWTRIYKAINTCRVGNGVDVGTISVR